MTKEEYNNRMTSLENSLRTEHIKIMQSLGENALGMIRRRILDTGKNAEGGSFTPDYTAKYKKYKQQTGKYKGFVDFSFTNRMWSNVQLRQATQDSVTIGAVAQENRDKMKHNQDKRGTILDLTENEINKLIEAYERDLVKMFHSKGL